jgi:UDP-N-acetylmuramate dehydrogenase
VSEVSPAPSPLARWTTLGLGGPAGRVAVARGAEEIVQSVRSVDDVTALILAGDGNVVIGDGRDKRMRVVTLRP